MASVIVRFAHLLEELLLNLQRALALRLLNLNDEFVDAAGTSGSGKELLGTCATQHNDAPYSRGYRSEAA